MRLRRKPWARPELAACAFYISDPPSHLGGWSDIFLRKQPIHLELGCGKGGFIAKTAAVNPDINYIALDIKSEVLALAKRNAEREFALVGRAVDNLLLMSFDIERIDLVLNEHDSIDLIYINFPNPWPKASHKKRRLTHPRQLEKYKGFLSLNSRLLFKTDDDELFEDTLCYLEASDFTVCKAITDHELCGIPTEHEDMFRGKGLPIHFVEARLSGN